MGFDFLTTKELLRLKSFVSIYNLIMEVITEFNRRYPGPSLVFVPGTEEVLAFLCDEFKQTDMEILTKASMIYSGCRHLEGTVICVGVALCGAATVVIAEKNIRNFNNASSCFFAGLHAKKNMQKISGAIEEPHVLLADLIQFAESLLDKKSSDTHFGALLLGTAIAFQHAVIEESEELLQSNYRKFCEALQDNELQNVDHNLKATAKTMVENTAAHLLEYLQDDLRDLPDIASPPSCIIS